MRSLRHAPLFWIYAAMFFAAAIYRFRVSAQPFVDGDTWGYLNPGLSKLLGGEFRHAYGRDSLYPGFVYAVLKLSGSFSALTIVQHVFGVLTGLLMALAWTTLCDLIVPLASPWMRLAGSLPTAAYVLSDSSFQYEHSLRPEALFPFFAILSLWLNLAFIRRRWFATEQRRAAVLGAGAVIASIIAYKLKPSFGLALGFTLLPALLSLGLSGMSMRLKVAMAATSLLGASALIVPESLLKQGDPFSKTFLPDTLFAVHADLIAVQLRRDLASSVPAPFPRELLEAVRGRLTQVLAASRLPANHPYPSLGFSPDYLLYVDNVFTPILPQRKPGNRELRANVEWYCYRRSAFGQPLGMTAKILRQMALFYRFGVNTERGAFGDDNGPIESFYARNVAFFNTPVRSPISNRLDEYPPGRALKEDSLRLSSVHQSLTSQQPVGAVSAILCWSYFPGLLAVIALAVVGLPRTLIPALILALVYGYNFGNNLTISVVHSLEPARYVLNELAFTLFASAAGLLFIGGELRRYSVNTTSSISDGNSNAASPNRAATSGA